MKAAEPRTYVCLCTHKKAAHVGTCLECDCQEYQPQIKHADVNQLQMLLDWRQAENMKEASKPCTHIVGIKKAMCRICFGEWFFWRTVRN